MLTQTVEYFHKGGLVMYPLLLCSILVVTIAVERYLFFRSSDSGNSFAKQYCEFLRKLNWQAAESLAQNTAGINANILQASMEKVQNNSKDVVSFMEVEAGLFIAQLRRRLNYLSVIVTMSPLLGLLGTIVGMMSAFSVFSLEAGQPLAITGGIGEALIATAMGLCVAIVALTAHAYFAQKMDNLITDMEQCFSTLQEAISRGTAK